MLTPTQLQALQAAVPPAAGSAPSGAPGPSGAVNSWHSQIQLPAQAKQSVKAPSAAMPAEPDLGTLTAKEQQAGFNQAVQGNKEGQKIFTESGGGDVSGPVKATSFGDELKQTGGLLHAGAQAVIGTGRSIFAPITASLQDYINKESDKPEVQALADSAPVKAFLDAVNTGGQGIGAAWDALEQAHPAVARTIADSAGVAGTVAGADGVKLPEVGAIKDASTDAVQGVKTGIQSVKDSASQAAAAKATARAADDAQKAAAVAKATKANQINIIAPKLTPTEMNQALATGKVVNRISPTTKSVTPDFSVDPHIQQLHESTSHLINPKAATATENLDNVRQGITDTSEREVKPLLEQNPVPFNFEHLRGALENVQPSSAIKADPAAFKNYNRIKEEILGVAEKSLRTSQTAGGKSVTSMTDFNDLWNPNKSIDSFIQKQLGDTALDTPAYTGVKAAAQDLRNASRQFMSDSLRHPGQMETLNKINQFIRQMPSTVREKLTPESIDALKEQFGLQSTSASEKTADLFDKKMAQLHDMFEVRDNLSPKARLEQGTDALSRYLKTHPVTAKIGKAVARTAGLGAGLHLIP